MTNGLLLFINNLTAKLLFFQFLFENMSKQITVKYYSESRFAKEPYQTTEGSTGYYLFAAETKTFLPKTVGTLSIDLRWGIPPGFYGKLFPRFGILKEHFVTIDAGVIDADFRGLIQVLILNHHPEKPFTVRTEDRIAQVVLMEKFNVNFHRVSNVHLLGSTKRGNDDFGSTGVQVIKRFNKKDEIQITTSESEFVNAVDSEEDLQTVPQKSEENLQITSEEAVITVNNEVVVHESITIDNFFFR